MNSSRFLKHLHNEFPTWKEKGWVTEKNSQAILGYVDQQASQSHFLASAIAILGVLLLGSGIVTYFAANWADMSKLTKLLVLFSSLYTAYATAGYLLSTEKSPKIGQAFLLLGVILFGANIMLIAQIYHIDSHYPNGVMFWALGGVMTAYLMRSQAALIAAIVLATLWTGMESVGFDHMHGWFILMWVVFLPAIYLYKWNPSLHIAMLALLLWSMFAYFSIDIPYRTGARLYLVQLFFVIYLALFVVGMLMHTSKRLTQFAKPIQNYSVIGTLSSVYFLTYPRLQSGLFHRNNVDKFRIEAETLWVGLTLISLAILIGLAVWHHLRTQVERPRYLVYAQVLVVATVLLILFNLFITGVHGSWVAIAFNLLFFTGVIWLVFAGMNMNNRFLINIAFIYFSLGLLTRYFDTFWTLLNRSFFFMVGGMILLAGGYLLEQQRRKITVKLKKETLKNKSNG